MSDPEASAALLAAKSTRRQFLTRVGAAMTLLPHASSAAGFQAPPAAPYDLLIARGHVVDPAQGLSAVRDVAIANGRVARVAESIPRSEAREVLDAAGKFVSPGWIDIHTHVFDGVAVASIDPDQIGFRMGVTTLVDAGSAGATTFAGFRKHVIDRAQTPVFALLNISAIGFVVTNESYVDPRLIDPDAAIRVIQQHRDRILGIKVRIDGRDESVTNDLEVMRRGRAASDATGVPVLMHWARDPRLLAMLKAGDIITHPFNPPRAGPDVLGPDGRIMPQFAELKQRGIFTDFAHGGHLLWPTAERAAAQGWFPDLISTDLHRSHIAPNGNVIDLATTMSKFLLLGMTLEQVVAAVTATPGRALKFPERIGALEPGLRADVTVFEVREQEIPLLDSTRDKRVGRRAVRHVATVAAGKVVAKVGS